jgi:transposase
MSKRRRKTYTQEFREGAVDLLRTSGQPLSQVARELGVSVASLRNWKNQFLGASAGLADGALGDDGLPVASAKELWDDNQRLLRENLHLKRQREILKKAASILAEDPQLGMR